MERTGSTISQWIQRVSVAFGGGRRSFAEVLEDRLSKQGRSLNESLESSLSVLGRASTEAALRAEDGPVALVCVDLIKSLNAQLLEASVHFGAIEHPWAQWTSERMKNYATALTDDVVHTYLVNAVLAEAAVTSELIPIEVKRLSAKRLEASVTAVLLRMRSTVFTRADLVQTATTLGRSVPSKRQLADVRS